MKYSLEQIICSIAILSAGKISPKVTSRSGLTKAFMAIAAHHNFQTQAPIITAIVDGLYHKGQAVAFCA